MRGVILSGILVAAMGCATVGKVGVDTGGMVRLASDCGISVKPPDPAKIPTAHPVAVGASSYLIDPAEVPPSLIVLFDETECVGAGPNGTKVKTPRVSVRVVKLAQEDTPDRAPAATSPQKGRYKVERELMPSEWDAVTGK
jgi:hypothetical protein